MTGPIVRQAVRQVVEQEVVDRMGLADARVRKESEIDAARPSRELVRLLARLRSTVESYVVSRRADGTPIERVLPEVKCLVREAASCEPWHDPADTLMAQVVRWTIAAFYDQPELRHVPRFY